MQKEIADSFLYDIDKFTLQMQRVLDKTPHEHAAGQIEFWTHFFLGSSITIQNSKLSKQLNIQDICFSIANIPHSQTKIVRLAFKVTKEGSEAVILRYVSIGIDDTVPPNAYYSNNELNDGRHSIKAHFAISQDIDVKTVDSKWLHINIKGSNIKLQDSHPKDQNSKQNAQSILKVQPLQLGKTKQKQEAEKTLDDFLNCIANPNTVTQDEIKSFFQQLIDSYKAHQSQLLSSEAAYHGYTYGVLVLNYHIKYDIDTYVEYSVGRGVLDLYFLLRKDGANNPIGDAAKIITEFKRKDNVMATLDAIQQIKDRGYGHSLVGRTTSNKVVMVGTDFGQITGNAVEVEGPQIYNPSENIISKITNIRQAQLTKRILKPALKEIFCLTRKEESLDRIILGELLSTNGEKNIFVIKDLPNNKRVSIFVFKNQYQKSVILTIAEQESLAPPKYERSFRKDPSKPKTRSNIESKQVTIEEEVRDAILHIQRELNINSGKRIDIKINPKGEVFKSDRNADSYYLDIPVNPLSSNSPQTKQSYISQFIIRYDIASNIELNNLIPALQNLDLEHMLSPAPHSDAIDIEDQSREINKLKEALLNLKEFITLEKDLKAILHGLFLQKKFNGQDITILTEISSGHGRADLALVFKEGAPLVLELGLGTSDEQMKTKQQQLKSYINYLKAITDAREVRGVVFGFNQDTTKIGEIIKMQGFTDKVYHTTSDDSPMKPSALRSQSNVQDLDNPQSSQSRIEGDSVNHSPRKPLSPIKPSNMQNARDQDSMTAIGSSAKRQLVHNDGDDAPIKKVPRHLANLEEQRDNIGLQASGSGCSTRFSSKQRLKRDLCQEKESEEIFPYEPLEENVAESSKMNARLYLQIAYLVAVEHLDHTNPSVKPNNVLTYATNIGDIISEGAINRSSRETQLLNMHYKEAQDFFNKYTKDQILDVAGADIDPSSRAWIFDNGKHSLLVSYDGNRYQIYSPDLNYRQSFQSKVGVSFTDIELYAEAFFKLYSNSIEYDLFTLKSNIPEEIISHIKQAKFWKADEVVSDLVLLDKASFPNVDGIPAKAVRELFYIDGKSPTLEMLHKDFFDHNTGKISIRLDVLHNVLLHLNSNERKSLINLVQEKKIPADTLYLSAISNDIRPFVESYHNKVVEQLSSSNALSLESLSLISWQVLGDKIAEHPDINVKLKAQLISTTKEVHASSVKNLAKAGVSQTLFFLPEIMKSVNTGHIDSLKNMGLMVGGDMTFNHLYSKMLNKLTPILSESRVALLNKLPVTSPIFKVLTIYSIVELHKALNKPNVSRTEADIIKHQLGEQYATVGLMILEMFGLEVGPLWIGLMVAQLLDGGEALRKTYHLDIDLSEAIAMSLGFEQEKLEDILEERHLVQLGLAMSRHIAKVTNKSFVWNIIKVPKLGNTKWQSIGNSEVPNTIAQYVNQEVNKRVGKTVYLPVPSAWKYEYTKNGYKAKVQYTQQLKQIIGLDMPDYENSIGPVSNMLWEQELYYIIAEDTTMALEGGRAVFVLSNPRCQEHNIFADETITKDLQYILISSVRGKEEYCSGVSNIHQRLAEPYPKSIGYYILVAENTTRSIEFQQYKQYPEPVVEIQGGLAALYADRNTIRDIESQENIYIMFNPGTGRTMLNLTQSGISQLDILNFKYNALYPFNDHNDYRLTVHVYDQQTSALIYPSSYQANLFCLEDSSKRVHSEYLIASNLTFSVYDNAKSTSITFANSKIHSISGMSLYLVVKYHGTDQTTFFNLSYKDHLSLTLFNTVIRDKLTVSNTNVDILHAQGAYNCATITIDSKVLRFNLSLKDNICIDIKCYGTICANINTPSTFNATSLIIVQGVRSSHGLHITFPVDNMQPVLDTFEYSFNSIKKDYQGYFNCNHNKLAPCGIHNLSANNTIKIEGRLGNNTAAITLFGNMSIFNLLKDGQTAFHTETINYDNVIRYTDSKWRLEKVFSSAYNSSYFHNFNNNVTSTSLYTLLFTLPLNNKVLLHHFLDDHIQINNISYFIQNTQLYAILEANKDIDYRKIAMLNERIPILLHETHTISIINDTVIRIDDLNLILYNLSENTKFVSLVGTSILQPISFRFIRNSFQDKQEEHLKQKRSIDDTSAMYFDNKNDLNIGILKLITKEESTQESIVGTEAVESIDNSEDTHVSYASSGGLWNWIVSKLSNFMNLRLLPGAEGHIISHVSNQDNQEQSDSKNYNQYFDTKTIENSYIPDHELIEEFSNKFYNNQSDIYTATHSIDVSGSLPLLILLSGQIYGTNKALSNNTYISPNQAKDININELNKTVKSAISKMEARYAKSHITNDAFQDILPSLEILFNNQENLNDNNHSVSILGTCCI